MAAFGAKHESASGPGAGRYKHVFGKENPKNKTYFNLQLTSVATEGPLISCSSAYWAVPFAGGGGPVYVSTHEAFGKVEPGCAVLNGAHKSAVQDMVFSPFNPSLLATGSLDGTLALWDCSASTPSTPTAILSPHRNSVRSILFHPSIPSLLASASLDQSIKLFDMGEGRSREVGAVNLESSGSEAIVNNMSYDYEGGLLAVACRDKAVRICDPRASQAVVTTLSSASSLGRSSRLAWGIAGNSNALLTASSLSGGQRTLALWDARYERAQPVLQKVVDNSSGQLHLLLDDSTGLCFLVGKGDTVVKCFESTFLEEVAAASEELPVSVDKASEFQTSREPFAGVCMLPKSSCDVASIEVARILKLTPDSVVPLSFFVPRNDQLREFFQDDLFPPVRNYSDDHDKATVEDWVSGVKSFPPELKSLQPEGMVPLSQRPVDNNRRGSAKADAYREQLQREEEERRRREQEFQRLETLATQYAAANPNTSMGGGAGGEVADEEWD